MGKRTQDQKNAARVCFSPGHVRHALCRAGSLCLRVADRAVAEQPLAQTPDEAQHLRGGPWRSKPAELHSRGTAKATA